MTVMRWNPWSEVESLQSEINRLFDVKGAERGQAQRPAPVFTPDVDIFEESDKFVLKFDLPEVRPEDVEISLENLTLQVKGERKLEREEAKNGYHRIERSYGRFARTFTLPNNVDGEKIAASAKDGVLRLELPKKAETQPRKISVATLN